MWHGAKTVKMLAIYRPMVTLLFNVTVCT